MAPSDGIDASIMIMFVDHSLRVSIFDSLALVMMIMRLMAIIWLEPSKYNLSASSLSWLSVGYFQVIGLVWFGWFS